LLPLPLLLRSVPWHLDRLCRDPGIRCVVAGSDDNLTVIRRDLLKDLAEVSHPDGIGVHQPVIDDDEVTLVFAQEDTHGEAQEDNNLLTTGLLRSRLLLALPLGDPRS